MPRCSVIIPTRNRVRSLAAAITSARAAARDVEVIVVDDASGADTRELCLAMSGIRYIRLDKNVGPAAARNVGISASCAPFLAFVDDDDQRAPNSIEAQLDSLHANPGAALSYGQVSLVNPLTNKATGGVVPDYCPSGDVFFELLKANFVYITTVVVRRKAVVEVGLFRDGFTGAEDWDLWLRIAQNNDFVSITEPMANYRDPSSASGQISSDRVLMCLAAARVQASALRLPRARDLARRNRRVIRRQLLQNCSTQLVDAAVLEARKGSASSAALALSAAVSLDPYTAGTKLLSRTRGALTLRLRRALSSHGRCGI